MSQHTLLSRLIAAAFVSALACTAAQAASATPDNPAQPMAQSTDTAITAKVKAALMEDKHLATLQIDVSTSDGVVLLKGSVPNAESSQQVAQRAATVPGVKNIRNELKVAS